MSGLDPISPFLALIDRLISLIQARKTREREYFEKIIDPLYQDFIPLGQDILKLFRSAKDAMKAKARQRKSKLKAIQAQRDTFADSRARLRGLMEAVVESKKWRSEEEMGLLLFVGSLYSFFRPRKRDGRESMTLSKDESESVSSAGREVAEMCSIFAKNSKDFADASADPTTFERELISYIDDALAYLEPAWHRVARKHMELKLKYTID